MGLGGLEPPTSPLSGARSNQLSYKPAKRRKYQPPHPHCQVPTPTKFAPKPPSIHLKQPSRPTKKGMKARTRTKTQRQPPPVELVWETKSTQKHRARPANFVSDANRLILGRLEGVLPSLAAESFDFVYLDPPFMTQKNFAVSETAYQKHQLRLVGSEVENASKPLKNKARTPDGGRPAGYSDCWQRTEYLNFLSGALQMLKPLLKKTGSIAVHTDFRASHYVRCLLDEHFSPEQFVNEIIWKYGLGNARSTKHFLRKHDNIAIYAADRETPHYFQVLRGEVTKAQKAKYCHEDEGGKFMHSYGKKYYLKGGKPLESVFDIPALSATSGERTGYPTQKPTKLLMTLIEALCPADGRVLDPCCGSGTTAVAAMKLGRKWTAIDANVDAVGIAESRLETLESTKPLTFSVEGQG